MEIVIVVLPNLSKYRKGSDLGAERDLDDMVAARLLYRNGTLFNCAYAMSSKYIYRLYYRHGTSGDRIQ
jgi:hypothetical protein